MSERERWIVYPLLFLALGAALRDKIIKTTESQRIKCQGLIVVDKDDRPLLILGAEQFPELTVSRDLLRVDQMESQVLLASQVESNQYIVKQGDRGVLQLNAQNGAVVANLLGWLSNFVQQVQRLQQAQQMGQMPPPGVRPSTAVPPRTPPGATLPPLREPTSP